MKLTGLPDLWPLTKLQIQLYNDPSRIIWCSAGRRARKTLILSRKLLLNALQNPGSYFQAAPIHDQAVRIFWDNPINSLVENTKLFWTRPPCKKTHTVYIRSGPGGKYESQIHVFGLHNSSRIDGFPWNGGHVTEVDECDPHAWDQHIEPALLDNNGFAYMDGVPEMGKGWYYRRCLYASGGALPKLDESLPGSYAFNPTDRDHVYYHWYTRHVIDPKELEKIKARTDPIIFRIEYEGSFESMLSAAYYQFGLHNLDNTIRYNPNLMVDVGMDFNVRPMTATLSHYHNGNLFQFGEIFIEYGNTQKMIGELKKLFPVSRVVIFPDSTGSAETANAEMSSIALLKTAGFKVSAPKKNPRQKDRLTATNAMLLNMLGEAHYKVNPDKCPKTVEGFNTTERKDDGTINKDDTEQIGHNITDAVSYNIYRRFPLRKSTVEAS